MDMPLYVYVPLLFLTLHIFTKHFLHKLRNLPPRPFPTLPLIGHLYLLKKPIHRALFELSSQHGPVLFLQFGFRPVLLVSSPSAAEECFTKNDIIFANRPRLLVGKHLGHNYTSLAWAPYGDHWRNLRRISSLGLLSSHRLQMLSHIRIDEVKSLIYKVNKASFENQDGQVELKSMLFELTYNIIVRMICGIKKNAKDGTSMEEGKRFQDMVNETTRLGGESSVADFLPFMRWFGFKGIDKRLMEMNEKRKRFIEDLIHEHRRTRFDYSSSDGRKKSMIESLLSLHESEPEYYTDEAIKSLMMVLLHAGTDTSVGTMEWAMTRLLNNPEVLKRAQNEIDNHVGRDKLINELDLGKLPYLHCIINETLRMHPVTPLLVPHESSEECKVGGFRIPSGIMLIINVWGIQNDPNVWEDPGKFKPERFEGIEGTRVGFKLIPFGSGRRGCPGENLAMCMVGLVLGSLIQCFDWGRVSEDMVDMTEGTGVTVSKAKPLVAKCRLRPSIDSLL